MQRVFTFLAAFSVVIALAFGQVTNGEILGTVTDASGAVVSTAQVTINNLDTGMSRETETGEDGKFRVPQLPPGNCSLGDQERLWNCATRPDRSALGTGGRVHIEPASRGISRSSTLR